MPKRTWPNVLSPMPDRNSKGLSAGGHGLMCAASKLFQSLGARTLTGFAATALAVLIMTSHGAAMAQGLEDNPRYAAIVVDAQSGETLYDKRADAERYPASLTKIMTLYMAFEALSKGELKPTDMVIMSPHANAQSPVKIGMMDGETINLDAAMRLTALYSANDLAVAIAEKVGGTESHFAELMTEKARALGMTHTRFVNASGLPDSRQVSSAHDLAILARSVMRDYPQYYEYFNVRSYEYQGRTYLNHNPLLGLEGIDGMKTGYTGAAGYNLVVSGVRGDHRLIAVMLGSSNKWQRREHVTTLVDTGFTLIDRRAHGESIPVAQVAFADALARHYGETAPTTTTTLLAQNDRNAAEDASAGEDVERLAAVRRDPALAEALLGSRPAVASPPPQPETQSAPTDTHPPVMMAMAPIPDSMPATRVQPTAQSLASTPSESSGPAPSASPSAAMKTSMTIKSPVLREALLTKTVVDSDSPRPSKHKADIVAPNAIWGIQVGAFKQKVLAQGWLKQVKTRFGTPSHAKTQLVKTDEGWFRTRFVAMTREQAQQTCHKMDQHDLDCMIIKPE